MTAWTVLADELLPKRLQEFVHLIGLPATMLMVERHGGLRIYIPAFPTQDHPFAELIGYDNFCALCAEYGMDGHGLRFELPRALRALNAVRNARIRSDYEGGKTVRLLAAEHKLTERHVTRIVADIEPKDERQAVFDWQL